MVEGNDQALAEAREILRPLPAEKGGLIIVLATAGKPPALAMLSSGDVVIGENNRVLVGLHGDTSAARRLGGAFSILIPSLSRGIRVEVTEASARPVGDVVLLEGSLAGVRHTSEPPWGITMQFFPQRTEGVADHVRYWSDMRAWLEAGAITRPPALPRR